MVETGATVDNLRRLARNQIDFGLVTTNTGFAAYKGLGDYQDKAVDNRLLWVYVAAPQNMIVRADSGVTTLEGLKGKKFNPGLRGSSTEKTTEAVFQLLGIEEETESVTMAGFVAELVGRVPRMGDSVERNGFRYTVLRAGARRAERIEVRRLGEAAA